MKTRFLKLLTTTVVILASINSFANHLTGGDLSYRCIGGNSYEFTLVVYNELSAQNQSSSIDFYELTYYSESLGIEPESKVFQVFSRGGGVEVPLYCPGQQNAPGARRVLKYTYVGVVNLQEAAPDWTIVFQQTARSTVINTAVTNLSTDYIVEAKMNTVLAPCNSSPQFNTNNHSIVNGYLGQETVANFGGIDTDGDQLVYSLTKPKGQLDEFIVYNNGYNQTNFISTNTSPTFDDLGNLTFTATNDGEIGISDVKIEEFRNGQLIASITRGIQVTTKTTENNEPVLSDLTGRNSFCEGLEVPFGNESFSGSDLDTEDNLFYSFFPAQYQSWFSQQNNTFGLVRTFGSSDIGTHTFTVTVTDDHCPETRSSQKTYTIEVNQKPSVSLNGNYIINCDNPLELTPALANEGDITYQWSNWYDSLIRDSRNIVIGSERALVNLNLGNGETYSPSIAQKTALVVENEFGCLDTAFVESFDSLTNRFSVNDYCYSSENPVTTSFIDASISSEYPIVEWKWSILPENVANENQNFTYLFENPGLKQIELVVTNSAGCSKTSVTEINVCEPQLADFTTEGEICTDIPKVVYRDVSDYANGCNEDGHSPSARTWWFGDTETTTRSLDTVSHEYLIAGDYEVVLKTTTAGGCVVYDTSTIQVGPRPNLDIFQSDSLSFICNRLDTTLSAVILKEGTGSLDYRWVKGKSRTLPSISSDSTVLVDELGFYTVFIDDEYGCTDSSSVFLYNPVDAKFTYRPVCEEGDSIEMIDLSVSNTRISSWEWTTENFNKTDSISFFSSAIPDIYKMLLEVTDSNGCSDTISHELKYLFVNNTFFIEKDSIQICATDDVEAFSYTSQSGFDNIDETIWYLGFGDTIKPAEGVFNLNFLESGDFNVYHRVIYNTDAEVHDFSCSLDTLVPINVKSEFKIDVFYNRLCLYDTGSFNIERITGDLNVPIVKTQWIIRNTSAGLRDTINEQSFQYYFENGGYHSIVVVAEDSLGCVATENASNTVSSRLPRPDLEYTSGRICANELGDFIASVDQTKIEIENVTDYYLIANNDTIVKGKGNPRSFDASYLFQRSRINNVTFYLEDRKVRPFASHDSLRATCRASRSMVLELIDLPILDVVADTLCPKEVVTITNLSKESDWSGPISSFEVLESGKLVAYPNTQTEWKATYPVGGYQPFVLIAKTDSGCVDTLKKDIYIKPGPKADFELNERFPEAFVPLSLLDISLPSVGLPNDTAELVSSFYDLGDGTTSNAYDLTHTWNEVKAYDVEHQVENTYGCRDTIIKVLDMRPYLDVPNAFSPNGDGTNDGLSLIYKSIIELQEFKIYNRWGQVIFDAGGDLDAIWDGRFKGIDQEVGVYVVYVKGIGTYDTQYEFKKNLTLIR